MRPDQMADVDTLIRNAFVALEPHFALCVDLGLSFHLWVIIDFTRRVRERFSNQAKQTCSGYIPPLVKNPSSCKYWLSLREGHLGMVD